jgi:hypothetical protein
MGGQHGVLSASMLALFAGSRRFAETQKHGRRARLCSVWRRILVFTASNPP